MKFGYTAYQILRVERNAPLADITAAHAHLTEAAGLRTDLPERVRANLQRSLDDALFTLSDPALRADHDAWIARHESGPRLDGANAYILPVEKQVQDAGNAADAEAAVLAAAITTSANQTPRWIHSVQLWLHTLRKAGSAVRMASRTLL